MKVDFKFDHAHVVIPPRASTRTPRTCPPGPGGDRTETPRRSPAPPGERSNRRATLCAEASQLIEAQSQARADLAEMDARSK